MTDERHNDYIRFRNNNDKTRAEEQIKMDNVILTCGIGLIGIAFGFVGLIFKEETCCWTFFSLSILSSCVSIASMYYSSWCSVKDVDLSNQILDETYENGGNINKEISSGYYNWVGILNNIAMIALLFGLIMFFAFVYTNIEKNKEKNLGENKMTNINISCEGNSKPTPTKGNPKPKPTLPKPTSSSGDKNGK